MRRSFTLLNFGAPAIRWIPALALHGSERLPGLLATRRHCATVGQLSADIGPNSFADRSREKGADSAPPPAASANSGMLEGIAAKREKRRPPGGFAATVPKVDVPKEADLPLQPKAEAVMEGERLHQQIKAIAESDPDVLDNLLAKYEAAEENEARVLQQDSLYQLDVSLKPQHQGGVRVFWKDVGVVKASLPPGLSSWFHIAVDGKKVKAFETKANLIIPGEDFAYAVAAEWGKQHNFINKLSMPLTDLASGAQHVSPQMISPRVDYLMSFFTNDNCYFRAEAIQVRQDALIDPVADWYGRVFDFDVPRVVGIAHPHPSSQAHHRVRDYLHSLNLNQYQIVALCVMAQCTASIMLPLALVNGVANLPVALNIMRAEEAHNVANEGMVPGYHDIRESDQIVKLAAALNGYRFGSCVSVAECSEAMMSVTIPDPSEV